MRRYFIPALCFAFILMASDARVFAGKGAGNLTLPTGTITLTAPPGSDRAPKLSPVLFPHSLHFSYPCKDCHHDWDGKSPVVSCSTSGCHDQLWAPMPGTPRAGGKRVKSYTGALHKSCRDCHREEVRKQKASGIRKVSTGPIDCEGCHPTPHSEVENSTDSLSIPLGTITIDPPEDVDAKRSSVEFPHGAHFDISCQSCHHDWDGESEVEGCAASGCHDESEPSGSRDINDPDNVLYYLAAYHNACLGCHRDMAQEIKRLEKRKSVKLTLPKAGPTACVDCHP